MVGNMCIDANMTGGSGGRSSGKIVRFHTTEIGMVTTVR